MLHVDDLAADGRYTKRRDPNIVAAVELGGVRTFLAVPMLKDNELIGALCRPDEWDPPIPVYDPYGPGEADAFVDDSCCAQRD